MRLYDVLFTEPDPDLGADLAVSLNPDSLRVLDGCRMEPALSDAQPGEPVQFERLGYFCRDPDSTPERPVFNRTLALRDTWARLQAKDGKAK